MDRQIQEQEEPAIQPEKEMDEAQLEQVSGGLAQPQQLSIMKDKGGIQNQLLPAVQKNVQKVWGDPHE